MFKDSQTGYIFASVALMLVFIGVASLYETAVADKDSLHDTIIAVLHWTSPSAVLTATILGIGEITMVLAARYRKRRDEEVRQEGREEVLNLLSEEERQRIIKQLEDNRKNGH